jgi:aryl carrier-like protein
MVPSAWLALDALPRLPNGKLDRNALPAAAALVQTAAEPAAPATAAEAALARICAEVLRLDSVGTRSDLFDLGADSIQLFQITARANREGMKLTAKQLIQHRTVERLVRVLEAAAPEAPATETRSLRQFAQAAQPAPGTA